jgi:hypothetical protein
LFGDYVDLAIDGVLVLLDGIAGLEADRAALTAAFLTG